jgi:succinate-semialdehyde dehydrogenase/glutarate-semialdehyde dehydrogenase
MKLVSINPSNNEIIGEVEVSTQAEINAKVAAAHMAKDKWRELGIEGRNVILRNFYDLLEENKQELAELQSTEMGMTITEAKEDIEGNLGYLRWYSDNALKYLSPEITFEDENEINTVFREPRGVVASIIPWNFPFGNIVWQCGQNLVAGNVVILKHSEEVPLFCKKFEEIVNQSDLPKGVLSVVYGDGKVGDMLIHSDINLICFTGSTNIGKHIYKVASDKFIPALLEMGGSAPGIILDDADLPKVIDSIMLNRFIACGQVCDGLKRLIVHESRLAEVIELLKQKISEMILGNAMDEASSIGPMVAERQVKLIEEQVAEAISRAAKIVIGGKRPADLVGAYFEPTLITDVSKDMRIWSEETFGPVLPVMSFSTIEEAISIANDTEYGLGSYIFTESRENFDMISSKLQAGMVSHNNAVYLKPCNPFGGYKQSGIGREHGKYGFEDLTQVKVIAQEK